jgi:hypothetical protein
MCNSSQGCSSTKISDKSLADSIDAISSELAMAKGNIPLVTQQEQREEFLEALENFLAIAKQLNVGINMANAAYVEEFGDKEPDTLNALHH